MRFDQTASNCANSYREFPPTKKLHKFVVQVILVSTYIQTKGQLHA